MTTIYQDFAENFSDYIKSIEKEISFLNDFLFENTGKKIASIDIESEFCKKFQKFLWQFHETAVKDEDNFDFSKIFGGNRFIKELQPIEDKKFLDFVEKNSAEHPFLNEIKTRRIYFSDLFHIDDRFFQEILRYMDWDVVTSALCGASDEMKDNFFRNLSKSAAEDAKQKIESLGEISESVVSKARTQWEVTAIDLYFAGEIAL